MKEERPDPDTLLARVEAEQARERRGRLKVFLGAAAGVGKTYAMLESARARHAAGLPVVVGYVEPHGRPETEALLEGLEQLPPRLVEYRGTRLQEFDLEAALARRPALILVDELAHTNAAGARHAKRWQDVTELLEAGIDVYTTVNIQHLESLNDIVARVTGVVVRETIPDSVLEAADELELVDLPPEDLLQRLREGKVYVAEQAERAVRQFFRRGNLIALRELALRLTAARVDAEMEAYRRDHAVPGTWPVSERILVAVSPSPLAGRVVRTARRMAVALRAEWVVAHVEVPGRVPRSDADRERVVQTLRLAEELGAETVTLSGHDVAEELLRYARARNVSKIVLGKPGRPRWREAIAGSVVNALVRESGDIDVYVITGEGEGVRPAPASRVERAPDWAGHGWAVAAVAAATALAWAMLPVLDRSNVVMVYLLAVVVVATRLGRGAAILASVLSVAAFDFFFVPPYLTFAVSDGQYLVTFGVMLVVALVISRLAARLRQQADHVRHRERRTAALYAMSRDLARARDGDHVMAVAVRHVGEVFGSAVAVLAPGDGGLTMAAGGLGGAEAEPGERAVAQWVYDRGQPAGLGSATLPGARALYLPLRGARGTVGVLAVRPAWPGLLADPDQLHLLEAFTAQTALALERARLAEEAQQATVRAETERLRSALLSAVSHDLRTPLATITGATSSLLESGDRLDAAARRELLAAAHEESERLNRLVANLLEMTRLEAGAVQVRKEWHSVEEIAGAALTRLGPRLADRAVTVRIPPDLPLVPVDGVLLEQVLLNLLDNALRHTPAGAAIDVSAAAGGPVVTVEVADRGPGIPAGDETRVFDRFYRGRAAGAAGPARGGVGLGLTVCKGIVEAHGGRIEAVNRPGGGVAFRFTVPLGDKPPPVPAEDGGPGA